MKINDKTLLDLMKTKNQQNPTKKAFFQKIYCHLVSSIRKMIDCKKCSEPCEKYEQLKSLLDDWNYQGVY